MRKSRLSCSHFRDRDTEFQENSVIGLPHDEEERRWTENLDLIPGHPQAGCMSWIAYPFGINGGKIMPEVFRAPKVFISMVT